MSCRSRQTEVTEAFCGRTSDGQRSAVSILTVRNSFAANFAWINHRTAPMVKLSTDVVQQTWLVLEVSLGCSRCSAGPPHGVAERQFSANLIGIPFDTYQNGIIQL